MLHIPEDDEPQQTVKSVTRHTGQITIDINRIIIDEILDDALRRFNTCHCEKCKRIISEKVLDLVPVKIVTVTQDEERCSRRLLQLCPKGYNNLQSLRSFLKTNADPSTMNGCDPPQIPTFLKVGALLRLVKRSGINKAIINIICGCDPLQIPTFLKVGTYIFFENGCLALLAMLVLHRAKLLASNQSVLALGVAPSGVRAVG